MVDDLLHQGNIKEVEKIIIENLKNLQKEIESLYNIIFGLYQKGNFLSGCKSEIEHFKNNLGHSLRIIKKIEADNK